MIRTVTILGSTGSIGTSTLDVIRAHRDRYRIHALVANRSVEALREQCVEFVPSVAVLCDRTAAELLADQLQADGCPTRVMSGVEAVCAVAAEADVVMAAIVGGAGLAATMAAAKAGRRVLLANKESLVMAGQVFMQAVRQHGATLLPIDSEHNAIFQSLANGSASHAQGVRRIWLTASGGPLLRRPLDSFDAISPDEACAHPNWEMGRKISVDSATMMNKGLELIEACWLFETSPERIEILIHPQSIVHSMVEYQDGSVLAQLGNPDMRTPIAHGLAWPERIDSGVPALDLAQQGQLAFEAIEPDRFPCLALARSVAAAPQSMAIALNAANEVAVQGFLDELIRFTGIPLVIEQVLTQTPQEEANTIEAILAIDGEARRRATELVQKFSI